jgi:protein-tyrosine phosphatase
MMKRILFLCSGNYYRSRFAEIFFNWHAKQRQLRWQAESRGLALTASNSGAMSCYTSARLEHHRIPYLEYARLPIEVTQGDFLLADHVVAVKETEHRPIIAARFPNWLGKVQFWEVHDLDFAQPDQAIPQLEIHVLELIERLTETKLTD